MKKRTVWFSMVLLLLAQLLLPGCRTREKTPEEPAYIYTTYYWYTEEEEVLRNTQYIVVGTVGKSTPDELKDEYGGSAWHTITDFHVEEVLYGSVEPDSDIQLLTMGAKGKEIVDTVEARGSFMEEGEKLLLFLRDETNCPGGRYDGMGIPVGFCGERTVDVDGNLGYRYDPFEKIYTRGDPPFYQYKTVEQLRAALPEWLERAAEWGKGGASSVQSMDRQPAESITLDPDSSVLPAESAEEGSADPMECSSMVLLPPVESEALEVMDSSSFSPGGNSEENLSNASACSSRPEE